MFTNVYISEDALSLQGIVVNSGAKAQSLSLAKLTLQVRPTSILLDKKSFFVLLDGNSTWMVRLLLFNDAFRLLRRIG